MFRQSLKQASLVAVVLLAVCATVLVSASAVEIYVPGDYPSIQAGVDVALPGDTIIVGPGTYREDPITIDGKTDIAIKSSDGADLTAIRGTINIKDSSGITIEGFTISSPSGDGIHFATTDPTAPISGIVIKDNNIVNCAKSGINFENSHYADVLIEGNDISTNGLHGIALVGTGENISIKHNTINKNGFLDSRGSGVFIGGNVTNVVIEENVITGNAFANIHPGS